MIRNRSFEIVDIAGEHLAVPLGKAATSFHGVVSLSSAAAFLLRLMEKDRTISELREALENEFEVDKATISRDIDLFIDELLKLDLIID